MDDQLPEPRKSWLVPVDNPFVLREEDDPEDFEDYEEFEDVELEDIMSEKESEEQIEKAIRDGEEEWFIERLKSVHKVLYLDAEDDE
jgi:hypothetical protein